MLVLFFFTLWTLSVHVVVALKLLWIKAFSWSKVAAVLGILLNEYHSNINLVKLVI